MLFRVSFGLCLFASLLVDISDSIAPSKTQGPLKAEEPPGGGQDPDANAKNEGPPGSGSKLSSILGHLTDGLNFIKGNNSNLNGKVVELIEKGANVEGKLGKVLKIPSRAISTMSSSRMDYFESPDEAKSKKEVVNLHMSKYLAKNTVTLPEPPSKSKLIYEKYIESYKTRCIRGDCLTLDKYKVLSIPNKVALFLPRLVQIDFIFRLFRQSGLQANDSLFQVVTGKRNRNSIDYLIELIAINNLSNAEYLNSNDEAVNVFYYKATLFFKKFTNESTFKNKLDSNKTLTSILGYFVKSDLIDMAQLTTYKSNLTLENKDLDLIKESYKKYLAEDYEDFVYLSEEYANMCQQCLQGSYENNMANKEMLECLINFKVDTDELCEDQTDECPKQVNQYVERCQNGDCYTLDNEPVTEKIKLKVVMPVVPEAKLAMRVFKSSKAHRGHNIIGLVKKIFRIETNKTLTHFVKMLTVHNTQLIYYAAESEKVLNQFLYQSTLFFVRFLTVSRLIGFYSSCKFTLFLFSIGRTRYLRNLARNITFGNKVALSADNLSIVLDSYKKYLLNSNTKKHEKIANYFAGMCKKVILHYITSDGLSSEMFDSIQTVKDEDVCPKENEDCKTFTKMYFDRCKKGDCYTIDMKDYYTSNRMYKLSLPILYQVEAAIYVFKNSNAYGSYADRLIRTVGPKKKVDTYVQFYRNLVTHNNKFINTKTFDNEIVNKYLSNAAIYFKFLDNNQVMGVEVNHMQKYENTGYKMDTFLTRMLKSLVGVERVKFEDLDIGNTFEIFQKYVYSTQEVKEEKGVKMFLVSCKKVFRMFYEMQNDDKMFVKYVKKFDADLQDVEEE